MEDKIKANAGLAAAEIAKQLEKQQISKYHTKGGHGFSAEDANAFSDKVRLRKVEMTGTSNELNGADRIVNGVKIQTKYYQTARGTVDSAFHSETGVYRYTGQLLEVPADQYEECIRVMEEKIRAGKIPGITDPEEAKSIIKKGTVTYKQARNIAKAGNIDSIKFDAKTNAVTSGYIFAISFAVGYAKAKWEGKDNKEATEIALKSAIAAGATTFVTGVVTAQVLRTRGAAIGVVAMRSGVKTVYKTSLGKTAVEKIAQASLGKAVYGAAAVNHVSKLLRSNVVTSVIATVATTTPDFCRATLARSISWTQFGKNLTVNAVGVAGGVGGWMGGAAIGTAVTGGNPVGGVVGGIVGALAGGTAGSAGTKFVADKFVEDDAKQMLTIVKKVAEQLVFEYMLSEDEISSFADEFKKLVTGKWLRTMYAAGNSGNRPKLCEEFAVKEIEPICEKIIMKRKTIFLPTPEDVLEEIDEIAEELELAPA
jgi:gas vesicle protein